MKKIMKQSLIMRMTTLITEELIQLFLKEPLVTDLL